ncbi:Calcium/proton antiporter [hydrothermal vent metagenome]|uniref:Calcium/proton antiporter n=1 Tax=hydrothermal vent metagenome TaxID=652676 RepID=A0A3B1DY61_9ZZZZ
MKEPYSSFVLTFSAIAIEIILLSIFLYNGYTIHNPQVIDIVKAGMLTAVIVDINFLLGLSVLIGGLSFKEQSHNEETSSTYTTVLLTSAVILLVPSAVEYINNDFNMLYNSSIAISFLLLVFYMGIFIFQTRTHSHFFANTGKSRIFFINKRQKKNEIDENTENNTEEEITYIFEKINNFWNIIIIVGFLLLVAVLSEIFSHNSLVIFHKYGISIGLAALSIAIISVAPEIFTSIKAAKNDEIQRAVNIGMGASTVSILLAIPIIMFISYLIGINFTLDFNKFHLAALIISVVLAWKTTEDGETNYFEGISHLVLFVGFIIMIIF